MQRLMILLFCAMVACSLDVPAPSPASSRVEAEAANNPHPVASCVFCADTAGKNDVKKLCPASKIAWDAMVTCSCVTHCSAVCGADWCARLQNPAYTDASTACNDCSISACWGELLACSGAM